MDSNVLENLGHDAKIIITYVQLEFEKMKSEFTDLLNVKKEEVNKLKEEVASLKTVVHKLENLIDDSDAYERRDTLIFSGPEIPTFSQGESCSQIIQKITKEKLKCVISANDISTAHRLGRQPKTQKPDNRSIIVKFCRRDVKNQLYTARKNQPNGTRVYVNESLTQPRQNVFHTLRKIRKACPTLLAGISTYDGRVYAYTKNDNAAASTGELQRDRRHLINNTNMLEKFCEEFLKKPLSNFLESFN